MGGLSNGPIPDPTSPLNSPNGGGGVKKPPLKLQPNRRPQIRHIVWGRREAWSPLWWWPCSWYLPTESSQWRHIQRGYRGGQFGCPQCSLCQSVLEVIAATHCQRWAPGTTVASPFTLARTGVVFLCCDHPPTQGTTVFHGKLFRISPGRHLRQAATTRLERHQWTNK